MASDLWTPAILVNLDAGGIGTDRQGDVRPGRSPDCRSSPRGQPRATAMDGRCARPTASGGWNPSASTSNPNGSTSTRWRRLDGMLDGPSRRARRCTPRTVDCWRPARPNGLQTGPAACHHEVDDPSSASPTDLAVIAAAIPHAAGERADAGRQRPRDRRRSAGPRARPRRDHRHGRRTCPQPAPQTDRADLLPRAAPGRYAAPTRRGALAGPTGLPQHPQPARLAHPPMARRQPRTASPTSPSSPRAAPTASAARSPATGTTSAHSPSAA